ncbi:MAG: alkaline shock response membrane anchor protein AmaP [Clostridia bacterium]|nr:alkaline shock response membrane anchor protein AmaP [Clostridia bacterium]
MKIRILDRVLVAFAGIILIAACAGLVGQVFFGKDVVGVVTAWLTPKGTTGKVIIGVCAGLLLILGVYCILLLFRHRSRRDKFIMQKMESGELAISLNTLQTMVQKCLDQHKEIKTENIRLENQRDGLLIRIQGIVAGGVSIPLTVDTLQKQVKQYVTACSGVEVKGIRVQIEASGEDAVDAPFAIEPPTNGLLPKGGDSTAEEKEPETMTENPPETEVPAETGDTQEAEKPQNAGDAAAAAMAAAESLMSEYETDDDRPIHQRLFSIQEEPCIMPLPPEAAGTSQETEEKTGNPEENKPESDSKKADAGTAEENETASEEKKGEENA